MGASAVVDQLLPRITVVESAETEATAGNIRTAPPRRHTRRGVIHRVDFIASILPSSNLLTLRSRRGPAAKAAAGTPNLDDVPQ